MIEVMANNGNKYKRINEISVILTFKDKIMSKWWRKKLTCISYQENYQNYSKPRHHVVSM